jgi:hypothetical protein
MMMENILLKLPTPKECANATPGKIFDNEHLTAHVTIQKVRLELLDKQMIEINRQLELMMHKLDCYSDRIYKLEKLLDK